MKNRILCAVLCLFLLLCTACGDDVRDYPKKTFTEAGISITLTEAFSKKEVDGATVYYESAQASVLCKEYAFNTYTQIAKQTKEEFAELLISSNKTGTEMTKTVEGNILCLEYAYYDTETDQTNFFFTPVLETADAYWVIQFICTTDLQDEFRDTFLSWCETISFVNA